MTVACLGLVVGCGRAGLAGFAGGVQGAGDLPLAEAGLAGGGGQGAEVGGRVGVQGAVGGPEQAGVAVAFGLAGDPPGQAAEVAAGPGVAGLVGCRWGCRSRVTASQSRAPRPRSA